jgi:hypothetical protein
MHWAIKGSRIYSMWPKCHPLPISRSDYHQPNQTPFPTEESNVRCQALIPQRAQRTSLRYLKPVTKRDNPLSFSWYHYCTYPSISQTAKTDLHWLWLWLCYRTIHSPPFPKDRPARSKFNVPTIYSTLLQSQDRNPQTPPNSKPTPSASCLTPFNLSRFVRSI